MCHFVFFFKQKTAYEMRISDWSSDVCSSDLAGQRCASGAQPFNRIGCGHAPSRQLPVDQLRGKRRALPPQRADPERGQGDAEGKTTAAPPSCRTSLRFPECHCRLKLLRRRRFPIKLVKAQDPARKLRSEEHTSELQ